MSVRSPVGTRRSLLAAASGENSEAARIRDQNRQRLDNVINDHADFKEAMTQQLEDVLGDFQGLRNELSYVKDRIDQIGGAFAHVQSLPGQLQQLDEELQSVKTLQGNLGPELVQALENHFLQVDGELETVKNGQQQFASKLLELSDMMVSLQSREVDTKEPSTISVREDFDVLQNEFNYMKDQVQQIGGSLQQIQRLEGQFQQLDVELQSVKIGHQEHVTKLQEVDDVNVKLQKVQGATDALHGTLHTELRGLKDQQTGADLQQMQSLQSQFQQLDAEFQSVKSGQQHFASKLQEMDDMKISLQSVVTATQELQEASRQLSDMQRGDFDTVQDELSSLKEHLENGVKLGHRNLDQLQQMGEGLQQIQTLQGHFQQLDGNLQSVRSGHEQHASKLQEVHEHHASRIQLLEGTTTELHGITNEISSILHDLGSEVAKIRADDAKPSMSREDYATLQNELHHVMKELDEFQKMGGGLQQLHSLQSQFQQLDGELQSMKGLPGQLQRLDEEVQSAKSKQQQVASKLQGLDDMKMKLYSVEAATKELRGTAKELSRSTVREDCDDLQNKMNDMQSQVQKVGGGFQQLQGLDVQVQRLDGEFQSIKDGQRQLASRLQEVDDLKSKIGSFEGSMRDFQAYSKNVSFIWSKLQGMESTTKEHMGLKDEITKEHMGLKDEMMSLREKTTAVHKVNNDLQDVKQDIREVTALRSEVRELKKQGLSDKMTALEETVKMNFKEFKNFKQSLYFKGVIATKDEKPADAEEPLLVRAGTPSPLKTRPAVDAIASAPTRPAVDAIASAPECKPVSKEVRKAGTKFPGAGKICVVCNEPCASNGRGVLSLPDGGAIHSICFKCTDCGITSEPDEEITMKVAECLRKGTYVCTACNDKKPPSPQVLKGSSGRFALTKEDLLAKPYRPKTGS